MQKQGYMTMHMKESKLFFVYKFLIMLLCIYSMFPWFMVGLNSLFCALALLFFSIILYCSQRFRYKKRSKLDGIELLLVVFMLWCGIHATIFGCAEMIINCVSLILILRLHNLYKYEILRFVTKYFSIFILLSLSFYVLWLAGVPLPSGIAFSGTPYECYNYYAFIIDYDFHLLPRFKSVFAEPGHLTFGLIPLIAANKFNVRDKYVLILVIAELFTISLAGYLCLFVMAFLKLFFSKKHRLKAYVLGFLLIVGMSFLYQKMKTADTLFYTMTFDRVERYVSGDSEQLGDRFKGNTIATYNQLMKSTDCLYGMGLNNRSLSATEGSSGYKVYIIYYGIIGLLLMMLVFYKCYSRNKCRESLVLFICCFLLLLQNAYPLWYVFIITYLLATPLMKYDYADIIFSSSK